MLSPNSQDIALPSDQDATGRTLGDEELRQLEQVIESGVLTSTKGTQVKQLEQEFAQMIGSRWAFACSSGSAAIHTAVAAIDPEPGDEIVTTPITDMGALTAIVYQGAIPVFADVCPDTYNVTAETIEARLSDRTKAIIVTHLFGNPCEMEPIRRLAATHDLPIIEDAAQAILAKYENRYAGTLGSIGCFSLQQGKHITTGEGGLVVTDDEALARRMFLFINKAWGYGDENPDHYFLAPNYRLTELQGAVANAQLKKLDAVVSTRIRRAEELTRQISDLPGISTPLVAEHSVHSYWRYCLNVDDQVIEGGAVGLGKSLRSHGIAAAPRYIQKPAFCCQVFSEQRTFGNSRFPFTLARPEAVDYRAERFVGAFKALEQILVLPWNEKFETEHVDFLARSIQEAASTLQRT